MQIKLLNCNELRQYKFRSFFFTLFLLIIKDLAIIVAIVNLPYLQSLIAEKCIDYFADTYNIELSVGDVYLKIPNQIVLGDVEMKDSCGNQLVAAREMKAYVEDFSFRNNFLMLSEVKLINPAINVIVDENGTANYDYILRKFETDDTTPTNINIICKKTTVENGHLKYIDKRADNNASTFKISDIDIKDFNTSISDFKYLKDTITVTLDDFSLNEKSGLTINRISSKIKYYKTGLNLNDLIVKTNYSELVCSDISIYGKDEKYLSAPTEKIDKVNVNIDTLIFCVADIGHFNEDYKELTDSIHVHGIFSGRIEDFKFKNFGISMGNDTKLQANLSCNGLPIIDQTIVFGNISNMTTSKSDINRILKIVSPKSPVQLPNALKNLERIAFNGNLSGMLNDMVAYGLVSTNLGTIKTDLALLPDWKSKSLQYEGSVSATNFNLHDIIDSDNTLGLVSLNAKVKGNVDSTATTSNRIYGQIRRFDFNGYTYRNALINGTLSNKHFDGSINVDDPNLQAEIIGKYIFGAKKQSVDFSCDVSANMKELNLVPKGTTDSKLEFVLGAELTGDIINRPNGYISLSQAKFNLNDKNIQINSLKLIGAEEDDNKHSITAESEFLDLKIYGDYKITEIATDIYGMIVNTVPALLGGKYEAEPSNNYLSYSFRIKKINEFIKFIDPEINVTGDIYTTNGYVFCDSKTLYGNIVVPKITKGNRTLEESNIELYSLNGITNFYYKTKSYHDNLHTFDNIQLAIGAENDSVGLNINWGGNDTSFNSGFFMLDTKFIAQDNDSAPRIEMNIHPAQFIFGQSVWQLGETNIVYDKEEIEIDDFWLSNANQSLNVKGYISNDPDKMLSFLVNNVDIGNLNVFTKSKGYEFGGILHGSGRIANLYEVPIFTANIGIDDLTVNQENLGKLNISSKWENSNKAFVVTGTNKYIELKGSYLTETDSLDASVMLKNFKLDVLEKYLNNYEISGIKGDASGILDITGSIKAPQLNGNISLKQTELVYDYLKLKAITEDKLYIENDRFYFDNFKVKDDNGNLGVINGGIYHDNFKDFKFDLNVNLDDYKVMNTKQSDNNLFFGTIYATGGMAFEGVPGNFSVYAAATTEQGSKFVLPMEDNYQAQNINYLTFVTPEYQENEAELIQSTKSSTKYSIKLDVDITPSTEVQIVFDSKAGDRIKANGEGLLKVEYNSDEDLYLYGEIEISKGDYLFTLENIINKRFTITPGGTITWSGNPYEGKLNIDAVYSANVSLKELMREEYDTTDTYNTKTNVECHMHLNGNLLSPEIQFSINIPNANDKIKTKLASLTQDEINKQLLYVLVLNQFYDQNAEILNQTGTTTNAVGVTTTEMLSNQLSNWISKIVKDVDVGFKYTPGTEVSGREIEVALSTQVFNERLLINGNLGISDKRYNNENLVGDVEVQWKLNKKGTIRLRGFSRKNTDLESEYGPYTTGAGIFYTEEFDTWKEVGEKIWNGITFKKAREKRKAKAAKE